MKKLTMGIGVIFILTLIACGDSIDSIKILSDRTELSIAAEIYANLHEDVRVIFRHLPSIDTGAVKNLSTDIVIGEDINSAQMGAFLMPVTIPPSIYPSLRGIQNTEGDDVFIPLAFTLPLIMGRREVMEQLPDQVVIREVDVRNMNDDFLRQHDSGRLTHLNFSPSWNSASYIDMLWLHFRRIGGYFENMHDNDTLFDDVRDELVDWISSTAGDMVAEKEFDSRYRYLPDEVLLAENRIQFARTEFRYWANIPGTALHNLDIRYFSGDRVIPIQSTIWGAVLRHNASGGRAEEFMGWLLQPETQKMLIERWESEGLTVFGFLGGLSSMSITNLTVIVKQFPSMRGMIPEDHFLTMQEILPDRWPDIRDEVVIPWFESALYLPENTAKLSESYTRWDFASLEQSD